MTTLDINDTEFAEIIESTQFPYELMHEIFQWLPVHEANILNKKTNYLVSRANPPKDKIISGKTYLAAAYGLDEDGNYSNGLISTHVPTNNFHVKFSFDKISAATFLSIGHSFDYINTLELVNLDMSYYYGYKEISDNISKKRFDAIILRNWKIEDACFSSSKLIWNTDNMTMDNVEDAICHAIDHKFKNLTIENMDFCTLNFYRTKVQNLTFSNIGEFNNRQIEDNNHFKIVILNKCVAVDAAIFNVVNTGIENIIYKK
jgi:hypothetical protein